MLRRFTNCRRFKPMLTVQKGKQLQVHMDKEWNNILTEG